MTDEDKDRIKALSEIITGLTRLYDLEEFIGMVGVAIGKECETLSAALACGENMQTYILLAHKDTFGEDGGAD